MEQVEQLCDDVCLISQSRMLLSGGLREIKQRFGKKTVSIDFVGDSSFAQSLADQELVRILSHSHQQVQLRLLERTSERHVLETASTGVLGVALVSRSDEELRFLGVNWLAGRIYRVGILMYGKKPSLRELIRWIRLP